MNFRDLQRNMLNLERGSSKRQGEMTRDVFFGGRQDITPDRLAKRAFQERAEQDYRNQFVRPTGVAGLSQIQNLTPGASRNMAEERNRIARFAGPTLSEIGSDIRFGIGRFAQDLADKGPPVVQAFKTLGQGFLDLFNRPNTQNQNQMMGVERQVGFGSSELNDFNSLNTSQQNTYNLLRGKGLSHAEAFGQAQAQTMAMGGIATLQ